MSSHAHAATYVDDSVRRRQLGRRAQLLAAASVSCNLVEAVIAITACRRTGGTPSRLLRWS